MLWTFPLYFHDDFEYEIFATLKHEKWISLVHSVFLLILRPCMFQRHLTMKQKQRRRKRLESGSSNSFANFSMNIFHFDIIYHGAVWWGKGWSWENHRETERLLEMMKIYHCESENSSNMSMLELDDVPGQKSSSTLRNILSPPYDKLFSFLLLCNNLSSLSLLCLWKTFSARWFSIRFHSQVIAQLVNSPSVKLVRISDCAARWIHCDIFVVLTLTSPWWERQMPKSSHRWEYTTAQTSFQESTALEALFWLSKVKN